MDLKASFQRKRVCTSFIFLCDCPYGTPRDIEYRGFSQIEIIGIALPYSHQRMNDTKLSTWLELNPDKLILCHADARVDGTPKLVGYPGNSDSSLVWKRLPHTADDKDLADFNLFFFFFSFGQTEIQNQAPILPKFKL